MIAHFISKHRMKTSIKTLLFFLISSMTFGQEAIIEDKSVTKTFESKGLSKSQILSRAESYFTAEDNPDKNVIESMDTQKGQLKVTGETQVLYKNIGKDMYPKRSGMAEVLEAGFGYRMELQMKENTFDISYTVVDMKKEMYKKQDVFFDCVNFNEINQEDLQRYNKAMNKLLKANFVFKKRRELFMENSQYQFEEVSRFLLNEGELKIFSLQEAIGTD